MHRHSFITNMRLCFCIRVLLAAVMILAVCALPLPVAASAGTGTDQAETMADSGQSDDAIGIYGSYDNKGKDRSGTILTYVLFIGFAAVALISQSGRIRPGSLKPKRGIPETPADAAFSGPDTYGGAAFSGPPEADDDAAFFKPPYDRDLPDEQDGPADKP